VLIPDVVVQMVEPLPTGVLGYIVVRVTSLFRPFNATVGDEAPTTSIIHLCKLSGDEECGYSGLGMTRLIPEDVCGGHLLLRRKLLHNLFREWRGGWRYRAHHVADTNVAGGRRVRMIAKRATRAGEAQEGEVWRNEAEFEVLVRVHRDDWHVQDRHRGRKSKLSLRVSLRNGPRFDHCVIVIPEAKRVK